MTKDKLVKFNRKATYYRVRKLSISFAAFLGLSVCVALPISIQIANANAENPLAKDDPNTSEVETSTSELESGEENLNLQLI